MPPLSNKAVGVVKESNQAVSITDINYKVIQKVLEDHNYPFYIEMSFLPNNSLANQVQKVHFWPEIFYQ